MKLFNVSLYYGTATIVAESKKSALEVLKRHDYLGGCVYGFHNKQIIFEDDFDEIPVCVQSDKEFVVNYYKE